MYIIFYNYCFNIVSVVIRITAQFVRFITTVVPI